MNLGVLGGEPEIGNPLLDGMQDDLVWGDYYKEQTALVRAKRCSQTPTPQQIVLAAGPRSVHDFASIFRGAQADIEDVRSQDPLPETADELCEVARRLGVYLRAASCSAPTPPRGG